MVDQPFLKTRRLVKRFGKAVAVDDVSLEVKKNEVLTLLGHSGCGKTTTLRIIAGFERPDDGMGRNLLLYPVPLALSCRRRPPQHQRRGGIGEKRILRSS